MSLFDSASLVITPNGYKAGKLYSIKPTNGAGDLDVVRATSATRVNANGLIEIPRTNLLLRSEEFNTTWVTGRSSIITNNAVAPNGTLTGDKLVEDTTASNTHFVNQSVTTSAGPHTFTIYAKAAERFRFILEHSVSPQPQVVFNLQTGVVVSSSGSPTSFSITSVGNGWYRCQMTATLSTSGNFRIFLQNDLGNTSYTGDGTSGLFLWGAQLEIGNVATEYIPTTSVIRTRFAGITQDGGSANNIPRLDYTNASCPSILVEPQRTNLLLRSEEFDNASWLKSEATILTNVSTSPDGSLNADKFIPTANNQTHQVRQIGFASNAYTFSVYAKAGEETIFSLWLRSASVRAIFDLSNGTIISTSSSVIATMTSVGNGWYRCSVYDPTAGTTAQIYGRNGSQFAGNGTDGFFLWGAQLEVGANATSYIPTQASTVTRNADVISKTGVSSLIGQTEGTIYIEGSISNFANAGIFLSISDATTSNRVQIYKFTDSRIYSDRISTTQSALTSINTSPLSVGIYKVAFAYSSGNSALFVNGVQVGSTATQTFAFGAMSKIDIGSRFDNTQILNDRIRAAAIYTSRLSNAELAQLTTL